MLSILKRVLIPYSPRVNSTQVQGGKVDRTKCSMLAVLTNAEYEKVRRFFESSQCKGPEGTMTRNDTNFIDD